MTTRIRKVITAIDANGNAFSEQHTETQRLNGTWEQNDPTTLTDGSVWATQYNAALEATNAHLVAAHKTALDAKEAELTTANATIATLASETTTQAATIATLQADNETKQTALDTANATIATRDATIAALESRVASLLTELPFNPRIIDASKFYERITKDEFAALSVSDDETLRTIAKTILAYKTNDWPVVFDSQEMQGMLAYLVGSGFLTAERAAQLTADASRAEAYNAD